MLVHNGSERDGRGGRRSWSGKRSRPQHEGRSSLSTCAACPTEASGRVGMKRELPMGRVERTGEAETPRAASVTRLVNGRSRLVNASPERPRTGGARTTSISRRGEGIPHGRTAHGRRLENPRRRSARNQAAHVDAGQNRTPAAQSETVCLPWFDGGVFSRQWKDALWTRFSMGARRRQSRSVENMRFWWKRELWVSSV
jgi:hypothetical protein